MKKLAAYYFSGTGNTKYVTEKLCGLLADKYRAQIAEIPSVKDLGALKSADIVLIAFPIYGGAPPLPVRQFAHRIKEYAAGKEFIIVATQYMFSGDGAATIGRSLIKWGGKVNYAEHFNMPNNLSDGKIFKVKNGDELAPILEKADRRIERFAKRILEEQKFRRGFNIVSHAVGYFSQRVFFLKHEREKMSKLGVDAKKCMGCGACVKNCPVQNLYIERGKVHTRNKCALCYRCVNLCPRSAISLIGKNPPEVRYRGFLSS